MTTITIDITEQQVAVLEAKARAKGMTLQDWFRHVAEREAASGAAEMSEADLQITDPEEWARRFHEWAESHDRTKPLLPDEALSRESIYPDRT